MKTRSIIGWAAAGAAVLLAAAPAGAQVQGIITKQGTGQKLAGLIVWQPASKVYVIQPKDSPVQLKIPPAEVADIVVMKPDQIDAAVQAARAGQYAQAIPLLEKIMGDYAMLQWDVPAARYLAYCYLKTKEPRKAVEMCERVLRVNEKAVLDKDFADMYWQGLLETDQLSRLRESLGQAVQQGSRELAAVAQLRRGDIDRRQGNLKEAVVDGYLRTVVFFQNIKDVQPEALYKAAQCFEELGQQAYAEKMRKLLLQEYPNSEYGQRVKAGG